MQKKIFSFLLAFVMVLSMLPVGVLAADDGEDLTEPETVAAQAPEGSGEPEAAEPEGSGEPEAPEEDSDQPEILEAEEDADPQAFSQPAANAGEEPLTVTAVGDTERTVAFNGQVTLQVSVSGGDPEGRAFRWTRQYWGEVDGADSDTLALTEVTDEERYTCCVTDADGSQASVEFHILVDYPVDAWAEGDTQIRVPYGESAVLKVNAEADDPDAELTYRWYRVIWDSNGDWVRNEDISGANTNTYTTPAITQHETFVCQANIPGFGSSVQFELYVDSTLTVRAVGSENLRGSLNDVLTMQVSVTASASAEIEYVWRRVYYDQNGNWQSEKTMTSTTDTCQTEPIDGNAEYMCRVKDNYGNTEYIYFHVGIENHLKIRAVGGSDRFGSLNDVVTMQVTATADDPEGITYSWSRINRDEEGNWLGETALTSTSDTCRSDPIDGFAEYDCTVRDKFGNTDSICFSVGVENHLKAYVVGSHEFFADLNGVVTLQVTATADDPEGITYSWTRITVTKRAIGSARHR